MRYAYTPQGQGFFLGLARYASTFFLTTAFQPSQVGICGWVGGWVGGWVATGARAGRGGPQQPRLGWELRVGGG